MKKFFKKYKAWIRIIILILFIILIFSISLIKNFFLINKPFFVQSPLEAVKSLPYVTWSLSEEPIKNSGVTHYNRKLAFKGLNIYSPRNLPTAYLMDMHGNILHKWSAKLNKRDSWVYVKMLKDGDLLSLVPDRKIVRLDWNSKVKWVRRMRVHHDIALGENGDFWTISRKEEVVFVLGIPVPILNDYIVVLSPDGKIKKKISLFKILRKKIPFNKVKEVYSYITETKNRKRILKRKSKGKFLFKESTLVDILHANSIEIIKDNIKGLAKKKDLLIAVRNLDLIGIIDIEKRKLIWSWGPGVLSRPHHPTLLANGNILIFDNGCSREYSRVIELNPHTKQIVWECKGNAKSSRFFTRNRGASQRLPNGNTLITNSNKGHVFEVTKSGDIVWEFYNPEIKNKKRAAIYRMTRIINPENYPLLKGLK